MRDMGKDSKIEKTFLKTEGCGLYWKNGTCYLWGHDWVNNEEQHGRVIGHLIGCGKSLKRLCTLKEGT